MVRIVVKGRRWFCSVGSVLSRVAVGVPCGAVLLLVWPGRACVLIEVEARRYTWEPVLVPLSITPVVTVNIARSARPRDRYVGFSAKGHVEASSACRVGPTVGRRRSRVYIARSQCSRQSQWPGLRTALHTARAPRAQNPPHPREWTRAFVACGVLRRLRVGRI